MQKNIKGIILILALGVGFAVLAKTALALAPLPPRPGVFGLPANPPNPSLPENGGLPQLPPQPVLPPCPNCGLGATPTSFPAPTRTPGVGGGGGNPTPTPEPGQTNPPGSSNNGGGGGGGSSDGGGAVLGLSNTSGEDNIGIALSLLGFLSLWWGIKLVNGVSQLTQGRR